MFFLIFLPNALSACFSVKLPILGLFLQNNLASLVPAETPVTTSDRCYVPHSGPALSRCGAQCKTWARSPMQDPGAGPFWAVILWRHHVQSTVLRSS